MYLYGGYSEFTVRGWRHRYPGYIYIYRYIHMYMYMYVHTRGRGRSSRRRPAGSVSGRSCSKIEGRQDRKLHPTADQGCPRGSPSGRRGPSRRNSKFKFTHPATCSPFALFFCLICRDPARNWYNVLIYWRDWRADRRVRDLVTYPFTSPPPTIALRVETIWDCHVVLSSTMEGDCNSNGIQII